MNADDAKRLAYSDFVSELLAGTPLIDGHNDLAAALRTTSGYSVENLDSTRDELHTDIVKLRRGGVGAQFWSVWAPSSIGESAAVLATLEQIDAIHRLVARYPDVFAFASTAGDIERVFAGGRIASMMGVEGGHAIGESLGVLRMFARLGVRYLTLTHNDDTSWAASATGRRQSSGLNAVGLAIVAEMNRIGMIVDLSHTAESTQLDALAASSAPVIFSHSSTRALTGHPRNVSDRVLGELGRNGGVLHVTFVPEFVSQALVDWNSAAADEHHDLVSRSSSGPAAVRSEVYADAPRPGETSAAARRRNAATFATRPERVPDGVTAAMQKWRDENPEPRVTVRDVADHVEHARDVAGLDHIGIGGDFDGTAVLPDGLETVAGYPQLFAELASRGWPAGDLRKLAGLNALRVMRDIEDTATEPIWPARSL